MWFTEWGSGRIGSLTPAGRLTEHLLPTPDCEPHRLAFGPDGALYAALEKGEILRLVRGEA
ncbi:hypothetical protein OTB20_38895 [Streptomyces sp. H27-H1]|nr:hypothetical protein [Streptomyces sp. H27-H1]MCY0932038.1 hypothetical protein [Streptomyces sp. H27-H1]